MQPRRASCSPSHALLQALRRAAVEYTEGRITSPERLAIPLAGARRHALDACQCARTSRSTNWSMFALRIFRAVSPRSMEKWSPTMPARGFPLFALDGPTVTGRRTAALTLLAIERLRRVRRSASQSSAPAGRRRHMCTRSRSSTLASILSSREFRDRKRRGFAQSIRSARSGRLRIATGRRSTSSSR